MAKLLCLMAILLVASAVVAEANHVKAPAPAPAPTAAAPVKKTFSLKAIIHNLATRPVSFKLLIRGRLAAKAVVANANTWTAIGPVKVGVKVPVVVIYVTVKNNRGWPVTRSFPVRLAAAVKDITPDSSKYFALDVTEVKSWTGRQKLLQVKVGRARLLLVKL